MKRQLLAISLLAALFPQQGTAELVFLGDYPQAPAKQVEFLKNCVAFSRSTHEDLEIFRTFPEMKNRKIIYMRDTGLFDLMLERAAYAAAGYDWSRRSETVYALKFHKEIGKKLAGEVETLHRKYIKEARSNSNNGTYAILTNALMCSKVPEP